MLAGEQRREVVVHMGRVAAAGHEHQGRSLAAPVEHLQLHALLDLHEPHLVRRGIDRPGRLAGRPVELERQGLARPDRRSHQRLAVGGKVGVDGRQVIVHDEVDVTASDFDRGDRISVARAGLFRARMIGLAVKLTVRRLGDLDHLLLAQRRSGDDPLPGSHHRLRPRREQAAQADSPGHGGGDQDAHRCSPLVGPYSYRSALAGFALATAKDCQDTVSQAMATAAAAASTKVQAVSGTR